MLRPRRFAVRSLAAVACLAGTSAVVATDGVGASTVARSTRSCSPPKYPGLGYFTAVRVSGTSCATGKKVALAYYRCRVKHGRAGHCTSRVLHFRCTEKRNRIPTQIDARVTCKYGSRTVVHYYQQDL